jgi:hypothetical protein
MHTIQIMLVEAETPQQAFEYVEGQLSEGEPRWSDWHNASNASSMNFAGRWEHDLFATDEQKKQIEAGTLDKSEIPNYLCYADDQELADQVIGQFLSWRKQSLRENVPVGLPDLTTLIDNYDPAEVALGTPLSMELWKLGKLVQMLGDDWTYESSIYDLQYYSASLGNFYERCSKAPHKQFLIPVDFHH